MVGPSSQWLVSIKAKGGEQVFGAAISLLLCVGLFIFWFNFHEQCAILLLFCSPWGCYNILARQERKKKHYYLSQLVAACVRAAKWVCWFPKVLCVSWCDADCPFTIKYCLHIPQPLTSSGETPSGKCCDMRTRCRA